MRQVTDFGVLGLLLPVASPADSQQTVQGLAVQRMNKGPGLNDGPRRREAVPDLPCTTAGQVYVGHSLRGAEVNTGCANSTPMRPKQY